MWARSLLWILFQRHLSFGLYYRDFRKLSLLTQAAKYAPCCFSFLRFLSDPGRTHAAGPGCNLPSHSLPAVPSPPWDIAFPRCLPVYQRKILSMNSAPCQLFSGLPLKMLTRMTWVGAEGLFMPCRCSARRAVPQPVCGQEGCGWPQCLFCLRRDHRMGWTSL